VEGRPKLRAAGTRATDERGSRKGRGGRGVLAGLPALRSARAVHSELAEEQARLYRVRARARDVGSGPPRPCTLVLHAGRPEPPGPGSEGLRCDSEPTPDAVWAKRRGDPQGATGLRA